MCDWEMGVQGKVKVCTVKSALRGENNRSKSQSFTN